MFHLKKKKQTQTHWDKLASEDWVRDFHRKTWGGIPQIAQNHNYLVTKNPDYYWIDYLRDRYFPGGDAGHVLSLGCGEGHIERLFKERGYRFESITGIDLSEACISVAKQKAREVALASTIEYIVSDLDHYVPAEQKYNFIIFFHSLHHVTALEQLLSGCARALLPGGILMANEFVGPSRFQWTSEQLREANALFRMLPPELRLDLAQNKTKEEIRPLPVEEMIRHDESEAVRSAEIETVLKRYFDMVEERTWGGTLNNLIFENTAGNYDAHNAYHSAIVSLLIHHENVLIEHNILPSDFKVFLARPKPYLR